MSSYSSQASGVSGILREALSLYRLHSTGSVQRARSRVENARLVEARILNAFGLRLENRDILEIGPGQFPAQLVYFAQRNRVTGIDSDVIVQGFDPFGYSKMLRVNGARRTLKTLIRKLSGVDSRFTSELTQELGIRRLPKVAVHVMDACRMQFPSDAFDVVYSRAVLHHLSNPGAALREVVRVLRPGGVAYIALHPYTSETGCLDPRIYTNRRKEVNGWPHLRPGLRHSVLQPNVYVNRLRLQDWRAVFNEAMPDVRELLIAADSSSLAAAQALQNAGELLEYSLEELLTGEYVGLWQKPSVKDEQNGNCARRSAPALHA